MTKHRAHVAFVLAATVLALAGCGSDEPEAVEDRTRRSTEETASTGTTSNTPRPKPPAATVVTIRIVGGRPQGGIGRPTVERNAAVVLVVRSDVADEVHLHGYDLTRPVGPGTTARLRFKATIPGRFEVELHDRGTLVAELTVR